MYKRRKVKQHQKNIKKIFDRLLTVFPWQDIIDISWSQILKLRSKC